MKFTWDEAKRAMAWEEHGVDLLDAALIFERPDEVEVWEDERRDYGEVRCSAIGRTQEGEVYHLTYAERDGEIRLITAWRLNERSRPKRQARYVRRAARDEGARRDPPGGSGRS